MHGSIFGDPRGLLRPATGVYWRAFCGDCVRRERLVCGGGRKKKKKKGGKRPCCAQGGSEIIMERPCKTGWNDPGNLEHVGVRGMPRQPYVWRFQPHCRWVDVFPLKEKKRGGRAGVLRRRRFRTITCSDPENWLPDSESCKRAAAG